MAREIKTKEAHLALLEFCSTRLIYKRDKEEHATLLNALLHAVKNATELALLKNNPHILGERVTLSEAIYSAVNHPGALKGVLMYNDIMRAIDKYLGIKKFEKRKRKTKRRRIRKKLLTLD